MRYATAVVAAVALGASASLYAPSAKAGVVIGIGLPVPIMAPRIAYYPYGPAFCGRGFVGPAFRGPGYYCPGFVRGGFAYRGYVHGGYYHGGYHR